MTSYLAIDPGKRALGAAVFNEHSKLERAWLTRNKDVQGKGLSMWMSTALALQQDVLDRFEDVLPTYLICEYPQVYVAKFQKGDQADLIDLAGIVGCIGGSLGYSPKECTSYLPAAWKGQCPKNIHHARILDKLSDAECKAIEECPESLKHNVYDAVGLGMFHLTKLKVRK